jgi:hypothetical protein
LVGPGVPVEVGRSPSNPHICALALAPNSTCAPSATSPLRWNIRMTEITTVARWESSGCLWYVESPDALSLLPA